MNKFRVESILKECGERRENVKLMERQSETIQETVSKYEKDIEDKINERMLCEKSSTLFKSIANDRNREAKKQIEDVLNYALSSIPLEQNYIASIEEISSKRSGRELTVILTDRDTGYQRTLKNQTGTWIAQVVSFILTMIVIKFSGSSKIMVLDEVFTGMEDHDMINMFGKILVSLAKNEDFQLFMVEHRKELDAIEELTNIPLGIKGYEEGTVLV